MAEKENREAQMDSHTGGIGVFTASYWYFCHPFPGFSHRMVTGAANELSHLALAGQDLRQRL
jgi:hypothetical protein